MGAGTKGKGLSLNTLEGIEVPSKASSSSLSSSQVQGHTGASYQSWPSAMAIKALGGRGEAAGPNTKNKKSARS